MRNISRPLGTAASPEERPRLAQLAAIDGGLAFAALLLAAVGLATVHSASSELAVDYLPRQAVWVGIGLVLLLAAMSIDYRVLLDLSLTLYGFSLVLLALVLVLGDVRGGARSWFVVGPWQFQPSELAKLATTLFVARFLSEIDQPVLTLRQIATVVGIVAAPMLLIVVEPDMGGAAMFVPLLAGMLLIAGVKLRYLLIAAVVAASVGFGLWTFGMQEYQRERVITYLQPERDPLGSGYHIHQSKIAVGSGQLLGKGYMQGTQSQLRFLPARHTDFILAVLAEEWGFLGVATMLGLYALYIRSGARIAMRARDRAGILVVVGLLSVFCFHVLYNGAMVIGFLPITGIPLPFLSYGGTFMLYNFTATGIILGVDLRRYVNR
ncbi:MAG TPA: rod shape-determining protein RodA [Thermoanaerobaculia bacterium]|nr:rod shape-determining protein RodA [Thermoanaerobaculia bacterium]